MVAVKPSVDVGIEGQGAGWVMEETSNGEGES